MVDKMPKKVRGIARGSTEGSEIESWPTGEFHLQRPDYYHQRVPTKEASERFWLFLSYSPSSLTNKHFLRSLHAFFLTFITQTIIKSHFFKYICPQKSSNNWRNIYFLDVQYIRYRKRMFMFSANAESTVGRINNSAKHLCLFAIPGRNT